MADVGGRKPAKGAASEPVTVLVAMVAGFALIAALFAVVLKAFYSKRICTGASEHAPSGGHNEHRQKKAQPKPNRQTDRQKNARPKPRTTKLASRLGEGWQAKGGELVSSEARRLGSEEGRQ